MTLCRRSRGDEELTARLSNRHKLAPKVQGGCANQMTHLAALSSLTWQYDTTIEMTRAARSVCGFSVIGQGRLAVLQKLFDSCAAMSTRTECRTRFEIPAASYCLCTVRRKTDGCCCTIPAYILYYGAGPATSG